MKKTILILITGCLVALVSNVEASEPNATAALRTIGKPNAGQALQLLKAGNVRFSVGKSTRNSAGTANSGNLACATILSCFDSRVPLERIFDVGGRDLFVVRMTGKGVDSAEVAAIEDGLGNTPLLVVFGHSQPGLRGEALIPFGIEEHVWQGIEDLFMRSPLTREQVKSGKVKVVGAIYDVASGTVNWLPETKVTEILAAVGKSPKGANNTLAKARQEAATPH